MKTIDLLEETYAALTANKVRTGLTMLGIIIGISSVIAMVAIGNGAKATISSSIESIGSNLIIITPGAIINGVQNISGVAMNVTARQQVTAKGTNTNTSIIGTTASYATVRNVTVQDGNFLSDSNISSSAKVAVIGPTTSTDLFGDGAEAVGQTIRIKGTDFKVIGVTAAKGGSGFTNADDTIYIPYTTAQHYLTGNEYLTEIDISAANSESTTQVQADATALLLSEHHISDPTAADFSVLNQSDIIATASSVTGTFTILLAAVAGISLLVGGIGIMNMMLTTVTERTREIGLRKAIGAKPKDISAQFLMESVALTVIGGLIGVLLGAGIAFAVTKLGIIQTQVSIGSVLLAFGVSAFIGIVFGWYPATRAAKMSPIEALRYE
jgi:putative ABC transport system permease protein